MIHTLRLNSAPEFMVGKESRGLANRVGVGKNIFVVYRVRGREEGFWVNLLAQVEFQYVLRNESVHVYDVCEFVDAGHC